jgi:hypothetical protein
VKSKQHRKSKKADKDDEVLAPVEIDEALEQVCCFISHFKQWQGYKIRQLP